MQTSQTTFSDSLLRVLCAPASAVSVLSLFLSLRLHSLLPENVYDCHSEGGFCPRNLLFLLRIETKPYGTIRPAHPPPGANLIFNFVPRLTWLFTIFYALPMRS